MKPIFLSTPGSGCSTNKFCVCNFQSSNSEGLSLLDFAPSLWACLQVTGMNTLICAPVDTNHQRLQDSQPYRVRTGLIMWQLFPQA